MDFKNIERKYRPIPFWSWNERLDNDETAEQIKMMNEVGIGGYFMYARGGLQTKYMGEEWFSNVKTAIDEGNQRKMLPWAYDENGWPSGFGNGVVNGLGMEYQQKYLRISSIEPKENVICKSGEHWFYFDVNPFYVDVLDKKVIAKFIEVAYEPYYEKFGNDFEGFFTDEPQISRDGFPWSFAFADEYQKRYNEDICEHLEELFLSINDYKITRVQFWKMVTEMFSESFLKQIYDWCEKKSLKLTGHMLLEESLLSQLTTNGACMPHYEYFHIPGMDWLGRNIYECLTPMQVSSVAEQFGKKQVLAETFALCGHNVSFAELKGIFEWQMVHGINLLCQHLEGYSIRGLRKRDYPPAMYYQQPWWCEYDKFIDAMSRIGKILAESTKKAEVLLIHPMTTAWSMFDDNENRGIDELDKKLLSAMKNLEQKHIVYHLGDEIIMERHAYVENGKLVIGEQKYSIVVDPGCEVVLPSTLRLIEEFAAQGGKVVCVDEVEPNDVTDNKEITYTKRSLGNTSVHYFVNTSADRKKAKINVCGKMLDIYTGNLRSFTGEHEFEPWGSLMIIDDGTPNIKDSASEKNIIRLDGNFKAVKPIVNMMTLDRCDYYFDGVLQEKEGYVLNICERANALERRVDIHQDYHVSICEVPEKLELVCETPEIFKICINGQAVDKEPNGWIIDKSFKRIDITEYIKTGENTISFDCGFKQSDGFYECMKRAREFETEKNKLVYDIEIEPVYLMGNFTVKTDGKWKALDNNAFRYSGSFEIDKFKDSIKLKNIEQQGYPFFCGEMNLEGEIDIAGDNPVLSIDRKGINVVRVEINGKEKTMMTSDRLSLKDFGVKGKTKIRLTLVNNLRNLLGPHHLKEGECHVVCPSSFFKESCLWNENAEQQWDNDYCFVETGV